MEELFEAHITSVGEGNLEGWGAASEEDRGDKGFSHDPYQSGTAPFPGDHLSPKMTSQASREPLVDVIEDEETVKVYVELPGVEREEIVLDAAEGELRVEAGSFHEKIDIPIYADVDGASSGHRNGVLEVIFPRTRTGKTGGGKIRRRINLD